MSATQEPINILLVEDNPGDAALLEAMLDQAGPSRYRAKRAGSLGESLRWMARRSRWSCWT